MSTQSDKIPTEHIRLLVASCKTIILATTNENGTPLASYAPFLLRGGKVYIFLSRLARHTNNLLKEKNLSIMFIRDENDSNNIFARQRLECDCNRLIVEKRSATYNDVLNNFELKFGDTVALLRSLPDFTLIELSIQVGNYVEGFGCAWTISNEQDLKCIFQPFETFDIPQNTKMV